MAPAILWPVHLTLGIQSGQGTAVRQRSGQGTAVCQRVSTLRNTQVRALDQREYLVQIRSHNIQFQ